MILILFIEILPEAERRYLFDVSRLGTIKIMVSREVLGLLAINIERGTARKFIVPPYIIPRRRVIIRVQYEDEQRLINA